MAHCSQSAGQPLLTLSTRASSLWSSLSERQSALRWAWKSSSWVTSVQHAFGKDAKDDGGADRPALRPALLLQYP